MEPTCETTWMVVVAAGPCAHDREGPEGWVYGEVAANEDPGGCADSGRIGGVVQGDERRRGHPLARGIGHVGVEMDAAVPRRWPTAARGTTLRPVRMSSTNLDGDCATACSTATTLHCRAVALRGWRTRSRGTAGPAGRLRLPPWLSWKSCCHVTARTTFSTRRSSQRGSPTSRPQATAKGSPRFSRAGNDAPPRLILPLHPHLRIATQPGRRPLAARQTVARHGARRTTPVPTSPAMAIRNPRPCFARNRWWHAALRQECSRSSKRSPQAISVAIRKISLPFSEPTDGSLGLKRRVQRPNGHATDGLTGAEKPPDATHGGSRHPRFQLHCARPETVPVLLQRNTCRHRNIAQVVSSGPRM
ncbi:hypothetical protein M2280_006161 [Prescottella agglutinans]|uniref:Uncharacterized protein n=1 Tax=Prescottella agglutinans TaxID=1644129 RepID=A0ABT6MKP6_9NOCA|nr:hypothetical protein [Prescottella agglutinans]